MAEEMITSGLLEPAEQAELYLRGRPTLLASWAAYARGAAGAAVHRLPGVAAAVFPAGPERAVYNNALLEHDLSAGERSGALDAMAALYAAAGVARFAAWVHESDEPMRAELEGRGYTLDTTTRAMGMVLDDIRLPRPQVPLGPAGWPGYLAMEGLAPDFLRTADHAAFHLLAAQADGELIAAALAYDFGGDCGIYNVGTVEKARRRGLGTALTAAQVNNARDRGCRTASLQSTEMAERFYAAVGFVTSAASSSTSRGHTAGYPHGRDVKLLG
jgi:GNAT superfamily N-acetyltransferase